LSILFACEKNVSSLLQGRPKGFLVSRFPGIEFLFPVCVFGVFFQVRISHAPCPLCREKAFFSVQTCARNTAPVLSSSKSRCRAANVIESRPYSSPCCDKFLSPFASPAYIAAISFSNRTLIPSPLRASVREIRRPRPPPPNASLFSWSFSYWDARLLLLPFCFFSYIRPTTVETPPRPLLA